MTSQTSSGHTESPVKKFLRATEIDSRMLGMVGAMLLIWVGFQIYGNLYNDTALFGDSRAFISAGNLWNLMVQSSSIAVMTCGMVLIIVMRHIDLSVGSILGFVAVFVGVLQARILPGYIGLGHPMTWIIALAVGICLGALVGLLHGYLIAYLGIPSFIVTLGGLMFWRGAAYLLASGATVAPLDSTFVLIGGGPHGSVGYTFSWILAALACGLIVIGLVFDRKRRLNFKFPLRPRWAELLIGAVGCGVVVLTTWMVNVYYWAPGVVKQYAAAKNITLPPEGMQISTGYAIPVLIAVFVGIAMTFMATRTRFGRYIYATGGNPEAAELAGLNTRKITMMVFGLMGALCGISACIASARLQSATNALGTSDELSVIAAAVIGGVSLSGGAGTIYGAILGALVMQSLQSGMVLIGFDAAIQQMVVGGVLVAAVFIDTIYRKKSL